MRIRYVLICINYFFKGRLTGALIGNMPEDKMVRPGLIKYNSFDVLEIQAFLYRPNNNGGNNSDNNNSNKKLGAVLSIHGGPTDYVYDFSLSHFRHHLNFIIIITMRYSAIP